MGWTWQKSGSRISYFLALTAAEDKKQQAICHCQWIRQLTDDVSKTVSTTFTRFCLDSHSHEGELPPHFYSAQAKEVHWLFSLSTNSEDRREIKFRRTE